MPEISLTAYENEVDQLIEQARYLEALAHVRHILEQYPHYVGAYYLLGKLMLEVDLPGLAVDMFRRALSADPEHLMARIGLGLAHERANDLDASIWNLERALELEPSNSDISDELRRMFGRRDGVEPDHITQTRAGLARLYIRGARPGRAVVELRKLLDDSPARPDLQTALAEAYWRDEQLVQASEVSQEILDKMPYNCKANLLLGSLWVNSGQDEGWTYLNRAQEIDLTNAMATKLFGPESLLAPHDVTLDRLVYDPDAIDVDQSSAWFRRLESASITVGISEAPPEMTESDVRLVDITAGLESQIEIPDWLRELGSDEEDEDAGGLGWMAGVGMADEEAAARELESEGELGSRRAFTESDVEAEVEEAATADEEMPDWLQELTTQEMSFDLDESETAPDWLLELVGEDASAEEGEADADVTEAAEAASAASLESSDWLTEFASDADMETSGAEGIAAESGEVDLQDTEVVIGEDADWLADLASFDEEAGVAEGEAEDEGAVPDWLGQLQATATEFDEQGSAEEDVADGEDIPDWLRALEPAAEQATEVSAEAAGAVSDLEDEDVPDWLRELESPTGDTEEAALGEAEDADWLSALLADDTGPAETVVAPTSAEEEPGDVSGEAYVSPAISEEPFPQIEDEEALSGEAALDWLDSLTIGEEAVPPPVEEEAVAELEVPEPADLDSEAVLEVETTSVTETVVEMPEVEGELPELSVVDDEAGASEAEILETEVPEPSAPGEPEDLMSGDDALAWLESLAEGKEEELRAQAEIESEARVAEILGRKPISPEVPDVEVAPSLPEDDEAGDVVALEASEMGDVAAVAETEVASPVVEAEDALLSGDDALAWLESLAAGKEEELRAQAEAESEARVAEILGRKPPAEEQQAEAAEAAPQAADEAELLEDVEPTTILEAPVEEPAAVEVEAPVSELADAEMGSGGTATEEGELLSGDDALAWFQTLTVGKEDELRAQAEAESEARVAEILGRKRPAPTEEAVPAETVEVEAVPPAEPVANVPDVGDEVAEEGESDIVTGVSRRSAFGEDSVEVVGPETEDVVGSAGEDARTWMDSLDPEIQADLQAQLDTSSETSEADETVSYFGWSAFGESPQEVAGEDVVPWEIEPSEPPTDDAVPEVAPAEIVVDASESAVEELEPEVMEAASEPDEPEPVTAKDEPVPEEPQVEMTLEAVEQQAPASVEPRPEAEASETTGDELDEMRDYVKKKRSDHGARLTLARTLWEAGEVQESMQHYGRLIKSSAKTDDVMADLEAYADSEAVQSSVMRTLGDAYMKFGDLDKALEIYNRAMDML